MTGLYVASNPTALTAQFQLMRNMGSLGETLTRLSTGLKINSGKDDPAGLIASELLKAQLTGTTQAITNTQRANGLIATADGSLGQISNLLNDIKGLTVEAANTGTMTADQLAANQLQVDAALDSIDRIARTTNYGGKKLLDGSLDFRTAGMSGGLSNVQINSANFGTASAIGVNVNVQQAADYARLVSNGTGVSVDTTFGVVGNTGSATVSVGAGSSNDQIAAAINQVSDSTGVVAYVEGKAERGSITLSSAGSNNDILVVAQELGIDAGNYAFRITRGTENDARIVQEAAGGQTGIVEISLVEGMERRYDNFAGLFNITVDTSGRTDPLAAGTSVTMTRGDKNQVAYASTSKNAVSNVVNGKSMTANVLNDGYNSDLNGWTIAVDNNIASGGGTPVAADTKVDLNTKTIYISTAAGQSNIEGALSNALADTTVAAGLTAPSVSVNLINITGSGGSNPLANGDRFTFSGGQTEGEVFITYKEGATANDILSMLNNAPNVSASLASGVNGNSLIPNIPNGQTRVTSAEMGGMNATSRYSSGATAQDVIDLINSKLGDKFTASSLQSDGASGGRVSYMDAAVDYGDINLGNALRFTGMDNGPIVRLTNLGSNGQKVANQQLGVNIIHPSESDIKAGIHTPILEIKLATDAQGNSITTAKDVADLFKTLTPEQTMGVSVAQLYPPGVDPNGRIFGVDGCGKAYVLDTCPTPINGIVQPTGAPGVCGPQQGDLLLLGTNQQVELANAKANVSGNRPLVSYTTPPSGNTKTTGTWTIAGLDLTLEVSPAGAIPVALDFDDTATTSVWDPAATPAATLILGVADYDHAQHGGNATDFLNYITGKLSAAGAPVINITNVTGTFDPTDTDIATAADLAGITAPTLSTGSALVAATNPTAGNAVSGAGGTYTGTTQLTFESTSAMNGLTFGFTRDETKEGFDEATGTLVIFLDSRYTNDPLDNHDLEDDLRVAVNDGIAANWEAIREYTGAVGDAVKLAAAQDAAFLASNATIDALASDAPGATAGVGKTAISSSYLESNTIIGTRGVSASDPALVITALEKGTQMAGINIHFINDTNSSLSQWNEAYVEGLAYTATSPLPDLKVEFKTAEDGSRELIVTGNLGPGALGEIDAGLLAKALNANSTFSSLFKADATQLGAGAAAGGGIAGSVLFNTDISKPSATTVGGYRIDSGDGVSTSSGVGMTGQADQNERLIIESEQLGRDQFVSINVVNGYLNTTDEYGYSSNYASGQDMLATVNGIKATTQGNKVSINTTNLSLSMDVANAPGGYGFDITGGGALFQLGPDVVSQQQIRVGIGSMLTTNLGGASGLLYQLRDGNNAALTSDDGGRKLADRIVNEAISNVANVRGRLGALQRGTLEPNLLALQDSVTAITENVALITNTDFAVESSNLMRLQLLMQAGSQALGIANQFPQYAASLMR